MEAMDDSFELPNAIGSINSRDSENVNKLETHKRMAEDEHRKTSSMSKHTQRRNKIRPTEDKIQHVRNRIQPEEIETNTNVKTLVQQATSLRKLKWVCAFLAISTVINTAAFGTLIHVMVRFSFFSVYV